MPKRVFWPAALIVMGLIFMASNLGLLPPQFWNLWPLLLIIVGLGGLLTSDREEWMVDTKKTTAKKSVAKPKAKATKKSAKSKAKKK
jgi:hypothetical protein